MRWDIDIDERELDMEAQGCAEVDANWVMSLFHRVYTDAYERGFRAGVQWLQKKMRTKEVEEDDNGNNR